MIIVVVFVILSLSSSPWSSWSAQDCQYHFCLMLFAWMVQYGLQELEDRLANVLCLFIFQYIWPGPDFTKTTGLINAFVLHCVCISTSTFLLFWHILASPMWTNNPKPEPFHCHSFFAFWSWPWVQTPLLTSNKPLTNIHKLYLGPYSPLSHFCGLTQPHSPFLKLPPWYDEWFFAGRSKKSAATAATTTTTAERVTTTPTSRSPINKI